MQLDPMIEIYEIGGALILRRRHEPHPIAFATNEDGRKRFIKELLKDLGMSEFYSPIALQNKEGV